MRVYGGYGHSSVNFSAKQDPSLGTKHRKVSTAKSESATHPIIQKYKPRNIAKIKHIEKKHCKKCGMTLRDSAEFCPRCGTLVPVKKLKTPADILKETVSMIIDGKSGAVFLDIEKGTLAIMDDRVEQPEFTSECEDCKTLLELHTNDCPICGGRMKRIVRAPIGSSKESLLDSLPRARNKRISCPICGTVTRLAKGCCPACGTVLLEKDKETESWLRPLIPTDGLIFVHFDVEHGLMSYLERNYGHTKSGELTLNDGGV